MRPPVGLEAVAVVLVCLAAGGAVGSLAAHYRAATHLAELRATLRAGREAEARMEQSLRTLAYEATAQPPEAVPPADAPRHEMLRRYTQRAADLAREPQGPSAALRHLPTDARAETNE